MAKTTDAASHAIRRVTQQRGGVVRTRALIDQGWSAHRIERAIAAGHLVRVRKGWVATPDADAALMAAARAGVVLTCITQARRLGLWVLGDVAPHVGAGEHSGRVRADGAVVHWARPLVPRHPDALVDPIENVLGATASCLPFEQGLAIWESALNKGLVDLAAIRRLRLSPAARRIAETVTPFADSGLESFAVPRLRWMRLTLTRQFWIAGRRVDLLIGERLVLQIDGAHHLGFSASRTSPTMPPSCSSGTT